MNVINLVGVEVEDLLNDLANTTKGTDEYRQKTECLTKLLSSYSDMVKYDDEHQEKETVRKFEQELRLKQSKDEKLDRVVKNVISVAGILIPVAVTVWGTVVSFAYDKEGIVPTTILGRGFINKLLPKK